LRNFYDRKINKVLCGTAQKISINEIRENLFKPQNMLLSVIKTDKKEEKSDEGAKSEKEKRRENCWKTYYGYPP
jgi:hypothetical protein